MNQYLKTIQDLLQQNNQLSEQDKQALLKTLIDADKQWSITEFKLDRTEKVKHTTAILLEETIEELEHKRKAVEEQNRELEIESSLEKVRTVAMGMRTRDDMLDICRTISEQLQSLGIKEIRNVQTAIFYQDKGTYINYEYYRLHDKALVTEVDYTKDEISVEFAAQMIKGADEVFIRSLEGQQVKDWLNFQKTTNVFIDTNLEKAKSLTYYWFSLGPVAIGTSTYDPLSEEEITLFKRFRNVFDLAYRRYLDIEKAEAQAYEAKIEASLERVRAVAMSLRKSEDLIAVCEVMYKELTVLGFTNIRNAQIAIKHDEKQAYVVCEYSDYAVNILQEAPYNSSSIVQELYNELGKTGDALYQKEFSGKEFEDWRRWRKSIKDSIDVRINEAVSMCFYLFSMGTGHVGISTFNAISNEQVEILKRFKNVFELSYRRYTDVAKAEAQAREAQIELALERVRARTMAMQKSDELGETSLVLFQQFKDLGETSEQISIGIFKEDENILELYSTLYGSQWKEAAKVDLDEPVVMKKIHGAWREQKKSLIIDITGNDLLKYNAYRKKLSNLEYREDRWVIHIAFFSKGVLTFSTTEPHPPETIQLLERFAAVFDQTYTRFLDLQKAEAQAREAQIQLALERVRARTMAMQRSEDLLDAASLLFKQIADLGTKSWSSGFMIGEPYDNSINSWMSKPDGSMGIPFNIPLTEDSFFINIYEARQTGEDFFVMESRGKELEETYMYMFSLPGAAKALGAIENLGFQMPKFQITHCVFFSHGFLMFITYEPCPEMWDIFKRFGKVFEQTYTRFLDLQKAEAQAREAQIEAALERVRSRSLAMHKSDELREVVAVVFEKLQELHFAIDGAAFIITYREGLKDTNVWLADDHGQLYSNSMSLPYYETPSIKDIWMAKESGVDFFSKTYSFEEKNHWFHYAFEHTDIKILTDELKSWILQQPCLTQAFALAKNSMIGIHFHHQKLLSEKEVEILKRFSKVFDQAYIRFLDLQKAEAQAREAKIEAALEKVRSKTMAMHNSQDVGDTVAALFDEFVKLGIETFRCGIGIIHQEKKMEVWTAKRDANGKVNFFTGYMDMTMHPLLQGGYSSWKKKQESYMYDLKDDDLKEYFSRINNNPDYPLKYDIPSLPSRLIFSVFYFPEGFLFAFTLEEIPEEATKIFKRFSGVFGQTYRRYLDLQKAEAQAREAQIEAALERVRSRSMGMQKSEELKEVIQVVYEQFVHLNIHVEHTGFIMDYKERDDMHIWLADKHAVPFQVTIPYFDCAHWNSFNEAKEKGLNFFANHLSFEEKNKFYQDLFKLIPGVPEETLEYYFSCPGLAISTVLLENVGLYIENFSGIPYSDEENSTLMRFGKVFQQTYTRFLDLQRAEAQAREAKIEAALEKVRSRSLAMHKSDELQDVVKSLFERLDELNVELNSAIIIIFSENSKDMVWWLINRMSEQFSRVFVKYQNLTYLRDLFKARQKELELFTKTYPADKKLELFNYLFEQTDFKNVPSERKEFILGSEYFTISTALAKSTGIQITSYSKNAFSEKENEILKRFAKVFDQSYTRFLDLQKAEAQAREAQIEAALERVRSKAMAMHKSEDLNPAVATVFEELDKLDLGMLRCGIGILNKEKRNGDVYTTTISDQGTTVQVSGDESMDIHPLLQGAFDAWLRRGDFSYALKGEDLVNYYKAVGATNIRLPQSQTEVKEQYYYVITFEAGGLFAFRETEFPEEGKKVMKRFANVFNLTYKRFLDLQKAEAQAREAQIEASLERVRASAMAMHNSNDISATTNIVFAELKKLDIQSKRCGVGLLSKNSRTAQVYAAAISSDGEFHTLRRSIDMTQHPSQVRQYESWLTQKNYISVLSGEELKSYYQLPFFHSSASYVRPEHYDHKEYGYYIPFSEGFFYAWTENPYSDNEVNILNRFKSIIDLTFRRFFDLQKAEAQAREAQIESALERVRSRTMAMHRSEEIADIVGKIFGELRLLDLVLNRVLIWIFNDEEKYISWWSANPEVESNAESYRVDYNEHPVFLSYLQAWQKRLPLHLYTLSGDTKKTWEDHLFINTELSKLPMPVRKGMREEGTIFTTSTTSDYGLMMVGSFEPLSDANTDIIQRFGRVFQQSYTRYLDVQKAEAQAREAKIEAAMEKVRSRAMAMQKPGELIEVAELLRKEMGMLGVEELETSSIYIHDEVSGTTECWYAIQDIREQNRKLVTDHMTIQLNDTWVGREMLKFYTSDQKQTSILMQGENRKEWINYCSQHSKLLQGYYGDVIPERTYHLLKFSNGYMGAASPGDISTESWELLKRATIVFSLAYTRFRDLQLAEANAKEAIKQSALDRIRADIASMRTIADLDKITPLIWNELTILGIPFIRCGVFIMDDSQKLIHSFLSTPEGKAIAAFHIPYDSPGNIKQVLSHWQNKKNYIDHWDEKAFVEFANTLVKQGALNSPQQYLKTIPKGGFHLHFLPFLQGMLYVGNTIRLPEDEIKLIQSVADAFSTAYARYEDFNKLEAAKQQVDKTLVDLKQAQTQLVQSEKMASLGELTAGIAHEIQNPLNFVNNFSDVSNELLDEMKTELQKGNAEDAMAIADDVKQNLEKILHHGKRADAIVKGMLQHSRMSSGQKELTDINNLADEYLRLAYHGLRAKDKSFNAKFETDFDKQIGKINIIPQDIGRVLVNLISNAFYAVSERAKLSANSYEPMVIVTTKKISDRVEIKVRDNGTGIPQKVLDKIFQPFFTTKPTGQGTGLGLSLAYDIITKGHGGELKVETKEGEGSEFIIMLPVV